MPYIERNRGSVYRTNARGQIVRRSARVMNMVARKAAQVAASTIKNKVQNYKFKSGKTKSRLQQKFGSTPAAKISTQVVKFGNPQTGNEFSKTKRNVGRYPKLRPQRLFKLMKAGMNELVLRAQGITNFDTDTGFYPLANRQDTSNRVNMPLHIWDLTSIPNVQSGITTGWAFGWDSLGSTANVLRHPLRTQDGTGAPDLNGFVYREYLNGVLGSGATGASMPSVTHAMHEWADIRLNLYGARKRGTMYYIDIVRVKDEACNFLSAGLTNERFKDLLLTLTQPLVYSNLNIHRSRNLKALQIIKSFKTYIPAGSADELDLIGKIKEFKIFLRQGNVYNLNWDQIGEGDMLPHHHEAGDDYTTNAKPNNHPHPSSRVFLMLRAFSPERSQGYTDMGTMNSAPANADTEPSYDLILRNKWLLPN